MSLSKKNQLKNYLAISTLSILVVFAGVVAFIGMTPNAYSLVVKEYGYCTDTSTFCGPDDSCSKWAAEIGRC